MADLGDPVAVSRGDWEFRGQPLSSEDWYYVIRTDRFVPDESNYTELEREVHDVWKWWDVDELDSATEGVIPGGLADLIRRLDRHPIPPEPVVLAWVNL